MDLLPTPPSLVDPDGRVRLGIFEQPLRRVGLHQAGLRWRGRTMPPWWVRFRLKEWQHYAIILPEVFVGVAVVDTKFLRVSWCSVVNRQSGAHFEHHRQSPRADVRLSEALWNERSWFHARGYSVDIHNHLEAGEHHLRLDMTGGGALPAVSGVLRAVHDLTAIQPLVVSLPVGENRAMYSHKVPLSVEGRLRIGDQEFLADPKSACVILDIHKAHYPRHTWWKWATMAGHDAAGRLLAVNLTSNVNLDDRTLNENVIWVDGAMQRLGAADFQFEPERPLEPWRLRSKDGGVDLVFSPQGKRSEELRLGLVRSVFQQPWGTFKGTLRWQGEALEVSDLFGVCEDHDAIW